MTLSAAPDGQTPVAFDALAGVYDDIFTDSCIGRAQRAVVWREINRCFPPGRSVLDFNCGTGADALHLARRGVNVVACDVSSEMIGVARRRLQRAGLASSVEFHVLATEDLRHLRAPSAFDGALSNFAGLNCVEDLQALGSDIAALLKPGTALVICVFGRWCLWEMLWYLCRGSPRKAVRRVRRGGCAARLGEGVSVQVRYPSNRDLKRALAPHFLLKEWFGVGVAVPPSYLELLAVRYPRLLRLCSFLDRGLSRTPVVKGLADHRLFIFERSG